MKKTLTVGIVSLMVISGMLVFADHYVLDGIAGDEPPINYVVYGTVTGHDNEPSEGATVYFREAGTHEEDYFTETDEDGKYLYNIGPASFFDEEGFTLEVYVYNGQLGEAKRTVGVEVGSSPREINIKLETVDLVVEKIALDPSGDIYTNDNFALSAEVRQEGTRTSVDADVSFYYRLSGDWELINTTRYTITGVWKDVSSPEFNVPDTEGHYDFMVKAEAVDYAEFNTSNIFEELEDVYISEPISGLLSAVSLSFSKDSPLVDEPIDITAVVENTGMLSGGCTVEFRADGLLLGTNSTGAIGSGNATTVTYHGWEVPMGTNNVSIRLVSPTHGALIDPENSTLYSEITPRVFDLAVYADDVWLSDEVLAETEEFRVHATIRNQGDIYGSCNVTFRLGSANGTQLGDTRPVDIPAGHIWNVTSSRISFDTMGIYTIYVVLEDLSQTDNVPENNRAIITVEVRPGYPNAWVKNLTGPSEEYEGNEMTFTAEITNEGLSNITHGTVYFYYREHGEGRLSHSVFVNETFDPDILIGYSRPLPSIRPLETVNVSSFPPWTGEGIITNEDVRELDIYVVVVVHEPEELDTGKNTRGRPLDLLLRPPFIPEDGGDVTIHPRRGDTLVPVDTHVTLVFSKPMNTDSVDGNFSLIVSGGTTPVDGDFYWSNENRTMVFEPDGNLSHGEEYSVRVRRHAVDIHGIKLDGNNNFTAGDVDFLYFFTTRYEDDVWGPVVRGWGVELNKDETEITLNATIDDTDTGGSGIFLAQFTWGEEGETGPDPEAEWTNMILETHDVVAEAYAAIDIRHLDDASTYYLWVRGKDMSNNTGPAEKIFFSVSDRTPPSNMTGAEWEGITGVENLTYGGALNVSWITAYDYSLPITYNIYVTTVKTGNMPSFDYSEPYATFTSDQEGVEVSMIIEELENDKKHYILIHAEDDVGNVAESTRFMSGTPTDEEPPYWPEDAMMHVNYTNIEEELEIWWTPAKDNNTDPNGWIIYNIYRMRQGEEWVLVAEGLELDDLPYLDKGLAINVSYNYTIRAVDDSGNWNGELGPVGNTTEDHQPPIFAGVQSAKSTGEGGEMRVIWDEAYRASKPITYHVHLYIGEKNNPAVYPGAVISETRTTEDTHYDWDELKNGEMHYFVVWAEDSEGNMKETTASKGARPRDNTPPEFVDDVLTIVVDPRGGAVELTWTLAEDSNTDPEGWVEYDVYRGTKQVAKGLEQDQLQFTESGLKNDVIYTYKVVARDDSGNQAVIEAEVEPFDDEAPYWPQGSTLHVNYTDGEEGELSVWWPAAKDNNTDPKGWVNYNVYRNGTEEGKWVLVAELLDIDDSPYVDRGLAIGIHYNYTMRAVDDSGNWQSMGPAGNTTQDERAPRFDSKSIIAEDTGEGKRILLTWDAATDASPVTYYIYFDIEDKFTVGNETKLANTTDTAHIVEVPDNDKYFFTVVPEDAEGNRYEPKPQDGTRYVIATATDVMPPLFDGLNEAVDPGLYGMVNLFWYPAEDNTGPIWYNVYASENLGKIWEEESLQGTWNQTELDMVGDRLTVNITELENGRTYHFGVRAEDSADPANTEKNDIVISTKPTDSTPPVFDGLESAEPVEEGGKIFLNWTYATDASVDAGRTIRYYVYCRDKEDIVVSCLKDDKHLVGTTTSTEFTLGNLQNGKEYFFLVRAVDVAGNMDNNTRILSATPSDTLPPEFSGLAKAENKATGGTVELSWSAATDKYNVEYNVYRSTEAGHLRYDFTAEELKDGGYLVEEGITTLSYTDTGLENGERYYYLVRAVDQNGNMEKNNVVRNTNVTDTTPPDFAGLKSVADRVEEESGTLLLIWDEATDEDTAPNANITYYVFRHTSRAIDTDIDSEDLVSITKRTSYIDTDLVYGTEYYYTVIAYDVSGNRDESDVILSGIPTRYLNAAPVLVPNPLEPVEAERVSATEMTFSVIYRDADGDAPEYVRLEISGKPAINMEAETNDDPNYVTGVEYTYTILLEPGDHTYRFVAKDDPGQASRMGPKVSTTTYRTFTIQVENTPPVLENPSVSPSEGDVSTVFRFFIRYRDEDGDHPAYMWLVVDGKTYDMERSPGAVDFSRPTTFSYSLELPEGSHVYYFIASDGLEETSTPERTITVESLPEEETSFAASLKETHYGLSCQVWIVLILLLVIGIIFVAKPSKKKTATTPITGVQIQPAEQPLEDMIVDCPTCGSKLQVSTDKLPLKIECPSCRSKLQIDGPPDEKPERPEEV